MNIFQMGGETTNMIRCGFYFLDLKFDRNKWIPILYLPQGNAPQEFPSFLTFSPETCGKDTRLVHLISSLELFFYPTGNDHTSPLKVAGTCSFRSSRIWICSQEGSHLSIVSWLGTGISTTTQNLPPSKTRGYSWKITQFLIGDTSRKVRMASWKITIFIGDRYLRCLINCESSFGWIGMADVCSTCRCNLSSECFATNLWLLRDGSLFHRSLWMMDVVRRIRHIPFWFQGLHLLKSHIRSGVIQLWGSCQVHQLQPYGLHHRMVGLESWWSLIGMIILLTSTGWWNKRRKMALMKQIGKGSHVFIFS